MSGEAPQQQRAQRRYDTLLQAAVELLEAGGLRAVSHRAVADRAGVPLAATTYYFRSRAHLVELSFEQLVRNELAWPRARLPDFPGGSPSPRHLAESLVESLFPDDDAGRARVASLYELCAQAGRVPSLRPLLALWTDGLVEIATETLRRAGYPHREPDARLLVALVDGLVLETFEQSTEGALSRATDTLTRALTLLRGDGGDPDGGSRR